jgi:hypothetical protein
MDFAIKAWESFPAARMPFTRSARVLVKKDLYEMEREREREREREKRGGSE